MRWLEIWPGAYQLVTDEYYIMQLAKEIMEEHHDLLVELAKR